MADLSGVNLTHQHTGSWGGYSGNFSHPGPTPFNAAAIPDYNTPSQQDMQVKFPYHSPNIGNFSVGNPSMAALPTQQQQAHRARQSGHYGHSPFMNPGIQGTQVQPAVQMNNRSMQNTRIQMPPNGAQPPSQNSPMMCMQSGGAPVLVPSHSFPSGDNSYGGYDSESMNPALRTDMHHKHKSQFYPSYEISTQARMYPQAPINFSHISPSYSFYGRPPNMIPPMQLTPQQPAATMAPHIPPATPRPEAKKHSKRVPIVDPVTGKDVMQAMLEQNDEDKKKSDNERKQKCADFQYEVTKSLNDKPPQLNNIDSVEASAPPEDSVYEDETAQRHDEDAHQTDSSTEDKSEEYEEEKLREYEKRIEVEQEQERIQEQKRLQRERIEAEQLERDRIERDKIERESRELAQLARKRQEHERLERERKQREHDKMEEERLAQLQKEKERIEAQRLAEEEAQRLKEEEAKRSQNVQNTVIEEPVAAVPSIENVDLSMPPPSSIPEASNSKKKKKQKRQKAEYSQPTPPARESPVPMQSKPDSPAPAEPEEKLELEQKAEEEAKRKVMEKNEENLKTPPSVEESSEETEAVNDEPDEIDLEQFRSSAGKMSYSRDYLLKFRDAKVAQTKPPNLPPLACVLESPLPQDCQNRMVSQPRGCGPYRDNMPDPLMPNFIDNQIRMNSGGNRHNMYNRGGGGQKMNYQQVIKLSINKPVELNKSDNAWVPDHKKDTNDTDEARVLYKKARGILNKLTPQKFDSLVDQFSDLPINTQTLLKGVIDLVFDKAVEEPNYCVFYAKLCHTLAKKNVPSESNENGTVNFRKLLLTKCQQEYEMDKMAVLDKESWQKKIDEETELKKKEETKQEMEEAEQKIRRRYLGNVRFIGELYKAGLISGHVMHECIKKMLTDWDEDKLECLCKLMVTIGASLEKDKYGDINEYFSSIKAIEENREKNKLSSRVRFMLQDLRDMKDNNWKPRREVAGPKKIAQVHEDMQKEALKEQLIMYNSTPTHGGRNEKPDRRGDGRKSGYNQSGGDEWNQVTNKRNKASTQFEKIDPKKLPKSKSIPLNDMKFGPGMTNWHKGSLGGRANQEPRATTNMFSALSSQTDNPSQRTPYIKGTGSRSGSQSKENAKPDSRRYNTAKQSYSQERRRPEESRQSLAARDGRGSNASSRESSASREKDAKSLLKGKLKGKPTLDDEFARNYSELYTDGYIVSRDESELLTGVAEKFSDDTIHKFVTNSVHYVLEKSPKERKLGGAMLEFLLATFHLSPKQLQDGFERVMESAEDLLIDIPKLFEYIGEILEPLLNSGNANKSSKISLAFLRDIGKSCIQCGLGSKMLAGVLKVLCDKSGERAAELWSTSGCKLNEFLSKDQDENDFIADNKFEFVFGGTFETQADLSEKILAILSSNEGHLEVKKLLNKAKETSDEKCVVRGLTIAILRFCCQDLTTPLESLENLDSLLLGVIQKQPELELECLLSVHQLMDAMRYPTGLPIKIFELLYDKNVVSEDSFVAWSNSAVKGEMVASTEPFVRWLSGADEESSSDKDGNKGSNEER